MSGAPSDSGPSRQTPRRTYFSHQQVISILSQQLAHEGNEEAAHQLQRHSDLYGSSSGLSFGSLDRDTSELELPRPSLSTALALFQTSDTMSDSATAATATPTTTPTAGFTVPSYLRGTPYSRKLAATTSNTPRAPSSGTFGLAYSAHRNFPNGRPGPALLPTRWDATDKHMNLEVSFNGLSVTQVGIKACGENEASAVRANRPVPPEAGMFYFEVLITQSAHSDRSTIGIGFADSKASLMKPPGWEAGTYGFHGDDGIKFSGTNQGRRYSERFGKNSTIGCGINFHRREIFYTKNGKPLYVAFDNVSGELYPYIGIQKTGESVTVNFGASPFVFDIDRMAEDEREVLFGEIEGTEPIPAPHKESADSIIQAMVMQTLQHNGYVETARAFATEIRKEREALSIGSDSHAKSIVLEDDHDSTYRQNIRQAVIAGDLDRTEELINQHYPGFLQDNKQIMFRLQCQRFVEMVRKNTTIRVRLAEKKAAASGDDMDVDGGGSDSDSGSGVSSVEPGLAEPGLVEMHLAEISNAEIESLTPSDLEELENKTLRFGQELSETYGDDKSEIVAVLSGILSMLAYPNPLSEDKFRSLVDRRDRVYVADELNSAILGHLGKAGRPPLEAIYATTSVLLEDKQATKGAAVFITVEDAMDRVLKRFKS